MRVSWNKEPLNSKPDWILSDEVGEIIGAITVLKNEDGSYNVEGRCRSRGYTGNFDNVSKDRLKSIVHRFKRNITDWYHGLRDDAQRPIPKKIYEMIDGIPMYLKDGSDETIVQLRGIDYGKIAEVIGKRELNSMLFHRGGIVDNIFPGIEVMAIHKKSKYKVLETSKVGLGDKVFEIDYKKDNTYGKKILIFEIKHGKLQITQNQLRRYCSMIVSPGEHFHKADEVKVVYMMFDSIDTMNATACYSIQELDKEFAKKILGSPESFPSYYEEVEI